MSTLIVLPITLARLSHKLLILASIKNMAIRTRSVEQGRHMAGAL